jgi:hypothetical protein
MYKNTNTTTINNKIYIGFHSKNPLEDPYQNCPLMYCLMVKYHGQRFLQDYVYCSKTICQKLRYTFYLTITTLDPPMLA